MQMEEATGVDKQPPPQRLRIVTKQQSSLVKRKPLANITNNNTTTAVIRKPPNNNILTPPSSTASDSSIGSTPNPIRPISVPPEKSRRIGHTVGNENQIAYAQRQTTRNTSSKTRTGIPSYQTTNLETRKNLKERSVPLCSSNLDKFKDQGKVNQSCLDKTINDGGKISLAPHHSSAEKVKDKRKTIDVPFVAHDMVNAKNNKDTHICHSTLKIKDNNVKENLVQSSCSLSGNTNTNTSTTMQDSLMKRKDKGKAIAVDYYSSIKNVKSNMVDVRVPLKGMIIKDRGEMDMGSNRVDLARRDEGRAVVTPNSLKKRKDKGKAIAVPLDFPSLKNVKRNILEDRVPLKGVIIKDRGDNATGSSRVDLAQRHEGESVVTPTNYYTLEKKDKRSSCPPLLRATSNRNVAEGALDKFRSKPQTELPPNKKMRRCSLKDEYALPKDFVEQQRAYFKEIDDFELEVEEV